MRVEFGVGKWLNQRPMLYALTHNPITPLLGVFVWASTELPWVDDYGWYLGKVTKALSAAEKKNNPECTHWAKFSVKECPMNQTLLDAWRVKGRELQLAISTSEDSRGTRWVLLDDA